MFDWLRRWAAFQALGVVGIKREELASMHKVVKRLDKKLSWLLEEE